jgi:hypothetical protein
VLHRCPAVCLLLSQVKYPGGGFVGTYVKYMIPGCLMLILYALVIPGFWFAAVYLNRKRLDVSELPQGARMGVVGSCISTCCENCPCCGKINCGGVAACGWCPLPSLAPVPPASYIAAARLPWRLVLPCTALLHPALPYVTLPCPTLPCPALRCPALPYVALLCPAPDRMQDAVTQAKYGFLYASYAPHLPYWETTEMLRKFAIAFMPVSAACACVWLSRAVCGLALAHAGSESRAEQQLADCPFSTTTTTIPASQSLKALLSSKTRLILLVGTQAYVPPCLPPPACCCLQVFIPTQANGSLQAAAAQIVLLLYIMLTLRCWPFAKGADNWLQLASLTGARDLLGPCGPGRQSCSNFYSACSADYALISWLRNVRCVRVGSSDQGGLTIC